MNVRRVAIALGAVVGTYVLLELIRSFVAGRIEESAGPQPVASILFLLAIPALGIFVPALSAAFTSDLRPRLSIYFRDTAVALALLFGSLSLLGLLFLRIGAPRPPLLPAILFLGAATLPGLGLFLASSRVLGPHPGAALGALLTLLLGSTIFWTNPWIENAPDELRPDRIEQILHTNPILVAAGGLLDDDLLRREWTYEHSVIGAFYRFEYPNWHGPARQYTYWGAGLWLLGLGLALLKRGAKRGHSTPE